MGTAVRRPARSWAGRWASWPSAGAALALRLEPATGTDTLVGQGKRQLAGDGPPAPHVRRRRDLRARPRAGAPARAHLGPRADRGPGGLPVGQRPQGRPHPAAAAAGRAARLAALRPAHVVFGPGTFINEAVTPDQPRFAATVRARSAQAERAARAARKLARAQGRSRGRGAAPGRGGQEARLRAVRRRDLPPRRAVRADQRAGHQRPAVRPAARVRADRAARNAQAALRLPVPQSQTARSSRCGCGPGSRSPSAGTSSG